MMPIYTASLPSPITNCSFILTTDELCGKILKRFPLNKITSKSHLGRYGELVLRFCECNTCHVIKRNFSSGQSSEVCLEIRGQRLISLSCLSPLLSVVDDHKTFVKERTVELVIIFSGYCLNTDFTAL